jgi:hypothetical protein
MQGRGILPNRRWGAQAVLILGTYGVASASKEPACAVRGVAEVSESLSIGARRKGRVSYSAGLNAVEENEVRLCGIEFVSF